MKMYRCETCERIFTCSGEADDCCQEGIVPPQEAGDEITGYPDHYIVNGDTSSCDCWEHRPK